MYLRLIQELYGTLKDDPSDINAIRDALLKVAEHAKGEPITPDSAVATLYPKMLLQHDEFTFVITASVRIGEERHDFRLVFSSIPITDEGIEVYPIIPCTSSIEEAADRVRAILKRGYRDDRGRFLARRGKSPEETEEPPVAETRDKAQLSHLAPHPLINALIGMMIKYSRSEEGLLQREKFVLYEPSPHIFWFGDRYNNNESFLDIFNRLARVYARRKGREKATLEDEIAVASDMIKEAGLEKSIQADKAFIKDLKARLSLQIEHFGVEQGTIYAMRKYKYLGYKGKILNHAKLERAIHLAAIKQAFDDDFNTYGLWRIGFISSILVRANTKFRDNEIDIPEEVMSYRKFAQKAHNLAQACYPLSNLELRTRLRERINRGLTQDMEVPTAGIRPSTPGKRTEDVQAKLLQQALAALPEEYLKNGMSLETLEQALQNVLAKPVRIAHTRGVFIFSEKATFDNGLGILLPKLVKSGIKVAVVATSDKQRKLIEKLNEEKPKEERIVYADSVAGIMAILSASRYYYFKVEDDPEVNIRGVSTFDITHIVKQIIEALGKACGVVDELLPKLHDAARKFAQAA
ncbi:MAG: hypothetical protein WBC74_00190 [Candidatus Omnitrophota bacterium]